MTTKLFVGNLSFRTDDAGLAQFFSQIGPVSEARVVTDRETQRSRGFGFVTMGSPEAAQNAVDQLNGAILDGRPVRVNQAEDRPRTGGGGGGGGGGGRGGGRGGYGRD